MTAKPRIFADFMKRDDAGRAILRTVGSRADLTLLGIALQAGREVVLYQPDCDADGNPDPLEVDATIE